MRPTTERYASLAVLSSIMRLIVVLTLGDLTQNKLIPYLRYLCAMCVAKEGGTRHQAPVPQAANTLLLTTPKHALVFHQSQWHGWQHLQN